MSVLLWHRTDLAKTCGLVKPTEDGRGCARSRIVKLVTLTLTGQHIPQKHTSDSKFWFCLQMKTIPHIKQLSIRAFKLKPNFFSSSVTSVYQASSIKDALMNSPVNFQQPQMIQDGGKHSESIARCKSPRDWSKV